jgi:pyruvate-formate lyase-activating enzyme
MTFRIETAARGRFTVFMLSGHVETQAIAELRRLFDVQADLHDVVVDLKEVTLVDREVMRFLMRCEADGVKLENCTPYIREWMEREKD